MELPKVESVKLNNSTMHGQTNLKPIHVRNGRTDVWIGMNRTKHNHINIRGTKEVKIINNVKIYIDNKKSKIKRMNRRIKEEIFSFFLGSQENTFSWKREIKMPRNFHAIK